ncbi:MAG: hypothetical protein AAGD10_20765 [Myxococcota bacterium]
MTTPIQAGPGLQVAALENTQDGPAYVAQTDLRRENPFLRTEGKTTPDQVLETLRTPLDEEGAVITIHQGLVQLLNMSSQELQALPPEKLNELFETVLRMARELPDSGLGRGAAILAVAVLAHHLDWRSGGEALVAALESATITGFVQLADALDATRGTVENDPMARAYMRQATDVMPFEGESLGNTLRLLIQQVESVDGSARDPASTRSTMRGLFSNLIAGAEQEKVDIMAQLQSGDLSEEGLMLLRTRLQDANNLISVLNEILKQENDVLEAIIRNFS